MAKHRRQTQGKARTTAVVGVVAAASTVSTPAAHAAEVVVPGTNMSVDIPGLENVRELALIPGIDQWIPSLAGQAYMGSHYDAVLAALSPEDMAVQTEGEAIVAAARNKIGAPYVWGAKGPNAFDCSGLVTWAYEQVGKRVPRTSYAQAAQGERVAFEDMRPGDIVVLYSDASHVGIYSGNGMMVHASTYGIPVAEVPVDRAQFHSAVRF